MTSDTSLTGTAKRLEMVRLAAGSTTIQGFFDRLKGEDGSPPCSYQSARAYHRDGSREPSAAYLQAIVNAFGVSLKYIVLGDGPMFEPSPEPQPPTRWADAVFDVVEDVAMSHAILPGDFQWAPVRELFGEVLKRRLEIESLVRRTVDDSAEVESKEVLEWAKELRDFLIQPLGMDLTAGMSPHEFTGHATGLLTALLRSMTESYRKARIEEAYELREASPPEESELREEQQAVLRTLSDEAEGDDQ